MTTEKQVVLNAFQHTILKTGDLVVLRYDTGISIGGFQVQLSVRSTYDFLLPKKLTFFCIQK